MLIDLVVPEVIYRSCLVKSSKLGNVSIRTIAGQLHNQLLSSKLYQIQHKMVRHFRKQSVGQNGFLIGHFRCSIFISISVVGETVNKILQEFKLL